mmetsp:Transcript_66879/g.207227  ORF Transcript_66879/g.207227 Transcript_66879/m.207227 type:complete len:162 (+) Transcript_66879:2563-3048(+)
MALSPTALPPMWRLLPLRALLVIEVLRAPPKLPALRMLKRAALQAAAGALWPALLRLPQALPEQLPPPALKPPAPPAQRPPALQAGGDASWETLLLAVLQLSDEQEAPGAQAWRPPKPLALQAGGGAWRTALWRSLLRLLALASRADQPEPPAVQAGGALP